MSRYENCRTCGRLILAMQACHHEGHESHRTASGTHEQAFEVHPDGRGAQKGADEAVHWDCAGDCAGPGCTGPAHGPQLATADDVIERRARYADTPGGHADAATLKAEALERLRKQLTGEDNGSDETEGDA